MLDIYTKEYVESLQRELAAYRKLGTTSEIRAALHRDSQARRRKATLRRWIKRIAAIAVIVLVMWFGYSWYEVVSQNTMPNPIYHNWNLFTLLFP